MAGGEGGREGERKGGREGGKGGGGKREIVHAMINPHL